MTQPQDRRWLILCVIGIAQLMVVLDVTIVNIALPSAQQDLGFSDDGRQWVITAYALAFGSLLLLGGRIGDLFGRKWTFIAGLLGFAGASALGGAATSFAMLDRGARAPGRVRRAARARRALAADDDVHGPEGARQGVQRLRRDRRHGRRDRPAARRRADRDARLALVPVRVGRVRGSRRDCRRPAARAHARAVATEARSARCAAGLDRPAGARVRPRPRGVRRLGRHRRRSSRSRSAHRCWSRSSLGRAAPANRCCRCAWSPTATAVVPSSPSASRPPGSSASCCS